LILCENTAEMSGNLAFSFSGTKVKKFWSINESSIKQIHVLMNSQHLILRIFTRMVMIFNGYIEIEMKKKSNQLIFQSFLHLIFNETSQSPCRNIQINFQYRKI